MTTVGIIGLGNIGMMYDYDAAPGVYLSHANAFYNSIDFEIRYLVDADNAKLELAKKKFTSGSIQFAGSVDEIRQFPEVIVLASVPSVNASLFEKIKDREEIKLIVIEKPFWDASFQPEQYLPYAGKCFINYFRKFIPEYGQLKQEIEENRYGAPLGAHVWYSKGLRNNGSHMVDLLFYLLGSSYHDESVNVYQEVKDYIDTDPALGFSMQFDHNGNRFPVVFQAGNEKLFSLIECDLLFEKGRLRIHDFGARIEIYEIKEDQLFPGYRNMESGRTMLIGFEDCMMHMTKKIKSVVCGESANTSDLQNEYNIYNLIHLIKQKSKAI